MPSFHPFDFLEDWFGEEISLDLVKRLAGFPLPQAFTLAEDAVAHYGNLDTAPPPIPLGVLRPYLKPRRMHMWYPAAADWVGLQSLSLLYAPEAVSPDPFRMALDGWLEAGQPMSPILVQKLTLAIHTLALIRPSVERGALYLVPQLSPSEAPSHPDRISFDSVFSLANVEGSIINRIGKEQFRRGGQWGTGVVNAFLHLQELDRDLQVISENADILQPFFLNGWDRDLAALILDAKDAEDDARHLHLGTLAAFDIAAAVEPISHSDVAQFRDSDAFARWRTDLASALSRAPLGSLTARRIQATVHEELRPAADAMRKEIAALTRPLGGAGLRQTLSVGAVAWAFPLAFGSGDVASSAAGATGTALLTAAWGLHKARTSAGELTRRMPFYSSLEPPVSLSDYELRPLPLF